MFEIISELFDSPAKGFATASVLLLLYLIGHSLKRLNDEKKIGWRSIVAAIVVLAVVSAVSLFLFLHKPAIQKVATPAPETTDGVDGADTMETENGPRGTPKEFCSRLIYLEENAGNYHSGFRGPKITDAGERAKYVSHFEGAGVDLFPATVKAFHDANYCMIGQNPGLPGPQGLSNYRCFFSSKNPLQLALRVKAQLLSCFPLTVVEERPYENVFKIIFKTTKDTVGPGYYELFYGGDGLTFSVLPTCAIPFYCPSLLRPKSRGVRHSPKA